METVFTSDLISNTDLKIYAGMMKCDTSDIKMSEQVPFL